MFTLTITLSHLWVFVSGLLILYSVTAIRYRLTQTPIQTTPIYISIFCIIINSMTLGVHLYRIISGNPVT